MRYPDVPGLTDEQNDRARWIAHALGKPGLPGCEPDDLWSVAVEHALLGEPMHWRAVDYLRRNGPAGREGTPEAKRPDRAGYARSTDVALADGDPRTLLDLLPAHTQEHAEPDAPYPLVALDTNRYGTRYLWRPTGLTARSRLPFGALRKSIDAYLSDAFPMSEAAERVGAARSTFQGLLKALGVSRSRSQGRTLYWQARKGEPLDPDAEIDVDAAEAYQALGSYEEAARVINRSPTTASRRVRSAKERARALRFAFEPVGDLAAVSDRDRDIVTRAAGGEPYETIAADHGVTRSRVGQILRAFKAGTPPPGTVPTPRQKALAERNAAIIQRAEAGERFVSIAPDFGLTPQSIGQIVKAHRSQTP